MNLYLGSIIEVRRHAVRPLRVQFNMGDGTLDVGWMMVGVGAWNAVHAKQLEAGVQVLVLDTEVYGDDTDRWRVIDIWPTGNVTLDDTASHLARQGDAVEIKGNPVINLIDVTMAGAMPNPIPVPTAVMGKAIGHNLTGKIVEDS